MTDLEKFKKLYADFGIECTEYLDQNFYFINLNYNETEDIDKSTISNKLEGYSSFYSQIKFNKNGKFISQGFWE